MRNPHASPDTMPSWAPAAAGEWQSASSKRSAEHGFIPEGRSAEHGFTPVRRSAEHGFTLVEVMFSLLIFGMLAAAGVAILSFSVTAQRATDARFNDIAALNRTVAILSADLAQAQPRIARDQAGTPLPAFTGEADGRMAFVRAGWSNVDAAPRASIQKVTYRFADGALERIAYPMIDGAAPLPPAVLLTKVGLVAARYRFRGAWSDRWDGAQGVPLPSAVELRIRRTDGTVIRAMMLVGTGYTPPPIDPATGVTPGGVLANAT